MIFQRTFDYPPIEEAQELLATVNSHPWRGHGKAHWRVSSIRWERRGRKYVMRTVVDLAPEQYRIAVHLTEGFMSFSPYQAIDFRRVKFGRRIKGR